MQPATTSRRPSPSVFQPSASSSTMATDSSVASRMNEQVLTTTASAPSISATSSNEPPREAAMRSESTSFFGQPSVTNATAGRRALGMWLPLPAVRELQRDAVVVALDEGDDALQLVAARGEHAELLALDLHLRLELLLADVLVDALGERLLDAVDDRGGHAHRAAARGLGVAPRERLEVDAALDHRAAEHVDDLARHEVRRRLHRDRRRVLVERDLRARGLQVVALGELAVGGLHRVVDLLHIHLDVDVETLVLGHLSRFLSNATGP